MDHYDWPTMADDISTLRRILQSSQREQLALTIVGTLGSREVDRMAQNGPAHLHADVSVRGTSQPSEDYGHEIRDREIPGPRVGLDRKSVV